MYQDTYINIYIQQYDWTLNFHFNPVIKSYPWKDWGFSPNCPHRSQWSPGVYQKVSLSFAVSVASALTAAVNKNVSFSPGRYLPNDHRASYQICYSLICSKMTLTNNNLLPNRRNLYLFMWHSGTSVDIWEFASRCDVLFLQKCSSAYVDCNG